MDSFSDHCFILSDSNQDLCEIVTRKHKEIYLNYLKINLGIINSSEEFPELIEQMCIDLNEISMKQYSEQIWLACLHSWINYCKDNSSQQNRYKLALIDRTVLLHLDEQELSNEPTSGEISCILDHIEIAGDSPKLWTTISLELEGTEQKPEVFWKNSFEKFLNRSTLKQKYLKKINDNNIKIVNKSLMLSELEQRVIEVMQSKSLLDKEIKLEEIDNETCRICLKCSGEMSNIFEESNYDNHVSVIDKITTCSCVTILKNDGLPQFICEHCLLLLNSAYQFRILCEKSDQELRNSEECKPEFNIESHTLFNDHIDSTNSSHLNENVTNKNCVVEMFLDEEYTDQTELNEEHLNQSLNIISEEAIANVTNENIIIKTKRKVKKANVINATLAEDADNVNKKKRNQCEICGITCTYSSTLKAHKTTHLPHKPFKCSYCGKEFKTKLSLQIHNRCHTNERPYVCETCGKAFKTCSAANNHRAIHLDEKGFKCPHCSYRANTKANLKIHDRTHTGVQPYACRFCPIKFSTASNMHKHIRNIHKKEKTHKCEQCDRLFFSRESARKHIVTHTGLKPFSCTECATTYGWYNGLRKHMKSLHSGVKVPTEKSFFERLSATITNTL